MRIDAKQRFKLHHIAYSGEWSPRSVHYAIQQNPDALMWYDHVGMLPVHIAASRGHDDIVKAMIHIKPEIALMCDDRGRTVSDFRGHHSDSIWDDVFFDCCCWGNASNSCIIL